MPRLAGREILATQLPGALPKFVTNAIGARGTWAHSLGSIDRDGVAVAEDDERLAT